jgi:hypothetical protein
MTQLEYSMIGSSCFTGYLGVDNWSECDEKEAVMPYWVKISDEAKEMAKWIDEVETLIYENADKEIRERSNELASSCFRFVVREQVGDSEYAEKLSQYGKAPIFISFFEDDGDIDFDALKKQDECGIVYDVDYEKIKEFFLKEFSFLANAIEKSEEEKKEKEINEVLQKVETELQKLIMFRGTKEEIVEKLNAIRVNREESVNLEPSEESLPENDLGFNTNLGEIHEHYISYEIYMLPTNKKDTFIITKVSAFQ